jgi:hypothetical protein
MVGFGANFMSFAGVTWLRRLFGFAFNRASRPRKKSLRNRKTHPGVESLEAVALLSAGATAMSGGVVHLHRASHRRPLEHAAKPRVSYTPAVSMDQTSVTLPAQTVSIGNTSTNFTNAPLTPALNLFNSALGTLTSVTVNETGTVQSAITSQNLSPALPAVITGSVSAGFEIDGLNEPFTQPTETLNSQPMTAGPFGSGTDTVSFPPLVITKNGMSTFTDASSLAFFTGTPGRSAITLTMDANAVATSSSPSGSVITTAVSSGSGSVTVTYTYTAACPTVTGVGRTGVHREPTELVVSFQGVVDPAKAADPADYSVTTSSGKVIPIESASYNPATNSVTLEPERRLNVHYNYKLSVVIPCPNMQTGETVVIPFGSKRSLISFHNRRGELVTVKNGKITGFYDHRDQFIPVHDGKIVKVINEQSPITRRSDQTARKASQGRRVIRLADRG